MSELSKNKKLKKLFDFGNIFTPRIWFKAVNILAPEGGSDDSYLDIPFDKYDIVETTYQDAKDLYESGEMKKGVFYTFKFIYLNYPNLQYDSVNLLNLIIDDLKVYIDKNNNLKAKGTYRLSDKTLSFISDYSFTVHSRIPIRYDCSDGTVHASINIETQNISIWGADIGLENFKKSLKILDTLGVKYDVNYDIENEFDLSEDNTPITIYDCAIIRIDEKFEGYYIYTKSGLQITWDDYEGITDYHLNNDFYGVLYNLNYGNYKHSYLISVIYTDDEFNEYSVIVLCDVDNNESEFIRPHYDSLTIEHGDIKHCNIRMVGTGDIYAMYTTIIADSLDVVSPIRSGYDYAGEEHTFE